ncbi:hypothetical protein ACQR5V_19120 [Xanthomonas oryzae pv. oryzicola]|uniref:hypothetical protein n=1 Tax=Xanthomonas oryzae TaxID=347 RepID=UPI0004679A35|nr:hypothetical protein [Xanthomonas oryzae]AJQ87702.1 hypothetical protein BE73_11950 [Xanthomonas oryzae pv. oryzicola]AJQ87710.1 hypothetical protein BE73_12000 [Xanthomonas oryzae pv. oryzicola]AKO04523.1 hypothetical protein ACU16_10625 [Xanthomonas oryzae pv. oryzicola]OWB32206.1 hypothetical protein XocBAI20_04315 [Xanthomonas oryzae pv. oryzicola]
MAAAPKVDLEQLGAVIDAFATINALMFTGLASREKTDELLGLLDLMSEQKKEEKLTDVLSGKVACAIATAIRGIHAMSEGNAPAAEAESK